MPRNDECNHPNCEGGPCKSLTREELTPTPADIELGDRLVAEGWIQTSSKYRHVRRWAKPGAPRAIDLITPEHRDTAWGRRAVRAIERHVTGSGALHSEYPHYDVTLYPQSGPPRKPNSFEFVDAVEPNPLVEEATLSPRQFAAYKAACKRREKGYKFADPSHWAASEGAWEGGQVWPGQPERTAPGIFEKPPQWVPAEAVNHYRARIAELEMQVAVLKSNPAPTAEPDLLKTEDDWKRTWNAHTLSKSPAMPFDHSDCEPGKCRETDK